MFFFVRNRFKLILGSRDPDPYTDFGPDPEKNEYGSEFPRHCLYPTKMNSISINNNRTEKIRIDYDAFQSLIVKKCKPKNK